MSKVLLKVISGRLAHFNVKLHFFLQKGARMQKCKVLQTVSEEAPVMALQHSQQEGTLDEDPTAEQDPNDMCKKYHLIDMYIMEYNCLNQNV